MPIPAIFRRSYVYYISLPAELENRVREHVASGLYGSASEVIREALRFFEAYQTVQTSEMGRWFCKQSEDLTEFEANWDDVSRRVRSWTQRSRIDDLGQVKRKISREY
jgi:putative addiction module CopG family antidote